MIERSLCLLAWVQEYCLFVFMKRKHPHTTFQQCCAQVISLCIGIYVKAGSQHFNFYPVLHTYPERHFCIFHHFKVGFACKLHPAFLSYKGSGIP